MDIKINKQDATKIKRGEVYSYGTFTDGNGNEFPFTICEMVNDNPEWIKSDITWVEDTPSDHDAVEDAIMEKFSEMPCAPEGSDEEV